MLIDNNKLCCKCKSVKAAESFYRNKSTKDGLSFECKACIKAYQALRSSTDEHKKYMARYRVQKKRDISIYKHEWWIKNSRKVIDKNRLASREYRKRLPDSYIRQMLGFKSADIELIELKRAQILLLREVRNVTY